VVNFHPRLNITGRPIANKYHEGKLKTTLKRELKSVEVDKSEAISVSVCHIYGFFPGLRERRERLKVFFFDFKALDQVKLWTAGECHLNGAYGVSSFEGGKNQKGVKGERSIYRAEGVTLWLLWLLANS